MPANALFRSVIKRLAGLGAYGVCGLAPLTSAKDIATTPK
jgi:hypothetical protein